MRSSLDSKDYISIHQVVTAIRDKKVNDFKEDRFGSFSCSYRQGSAKVPRGLAGFSKTLADQDEGTPKIVRRSKFGILRDRARRARMPRSRSQDVQSVPAGGVQIPHRTVPTLPQKKPISKSSDGRLKEFLANKLQAYRQRVTHLKTKERIGSKDERKQRWDCKAEFPALTVAAAALPRQTKLHRKEGLLTLNPVSNRQFLTLLYIVERLSDIAEVLNKHTTTIHCSYVSGQIEHYRAMYVQVIMYLLYNMSSIFSYRF